MPETRPFSSYSRTLCLFKLRPSNNRLSRSGKASSPKSSTTTIRSSIAIVITMFVQNVFTSVEWRSNVGRWITRRGGRGEGMERDAVLFEYGDDDDYIEWERARRAAWVKRGEELEEDLRELRKWEPEESLSDAAREEQMLLWMEQMALLNVTIGAGGVLKPRGVERPYYTYLVRRSNFQVTIAGQFEVAGGLRLMAGPPPYPLV
ncbi:hypothetical protein M422DRAFT_258317 [Sphaerobolus stellatus SS14]|uniref:Uncharacterized protein n=1 Tax=Sphaerobolus stellatus (strain SS14) TaxID=990650 RepID=A0A0C9UVQ1_SPHS4|nr:hypothetical protein M422DRAFT_258317 [Sphaerobolus stellatus SS14]